MILASFIWYINNKTNDPIYDILMKNTDISEPVVLSIDRNNQSKQKEMLGIVKENRTRTVYYDDDKGHTCEIEKFVKV